MLINFNYTLSLLKVFKQIQTGEKNENNTKIKICPELTIIVGSCFFFRTDIKLFLCLLLNGGEDKNFQFILLVKFNWKFFQNEENEKSISLLSVEKLRYWLIKPEMKNTSKKYLDK